MFKFLCGPPLSSVALRFDSAFPLGVMEEWRDAARTKTKAGYHWIHRAGTGQNFRNLSGQNFRKSHAVAASSVHAVQDGVLTNTAVGFLRSATTAHPAPRGLPAADGDLSARSKTGGSGSGTLVERADNPEPDSRLGAQVPAVSAVAKGRSLSACPSWARPLRYPGGHSAPVEFRNAEGRLRPRPWPTIPSLCRKMT